MTDAKGNILYMSNLYSVDKHDCPLFKPSFEAFIAQLARLNIVFAQHTLVNLDSGFDSKTNQKVCKENTCIANIKVNPRNSKKIGVAPFPEEYKQRYVNERCFAWEDTYRRLVIRYEVKPQNHIAFCNIAAALTLLRLIRN